MSICDIDSDAGDEMVEQLIIKHGKDKVLYCQCDVTDYCQFEGNYF